MKNTVISFGVVLILALVGTFYWYQYRPSTIRKNCDIIATNKAKELLNTKSELDPGNTELKAAVDKGLSAKDDYNAYYDKCLHSSGLN